MPVVIDEVDAQIEVEGGATGERAAAAALLQWTEMQRRADELAARTAAFEFDD